MEKMSAILGLGISFVLMAMGIGLPNFGNFIDPPSILIVIGGTIGTTLIVYGMSGLKLTISLIKVALTRTDIDRMNELLRIYNLAIKARKKNLLALEEDCQTIEDEFLKQGLQMVIDGISPDIVKNILEKEIENTYQRHSTSHDILSYMAEAAPAFGMVGTLIGLVGMLQDLSDPDAIGPNMAKALLTTFYGAVMANVIFSPISKKLQTITDSEVTLKEAILEGLLSIQASEAPSTTEAKLTAYLSPKMKVLFKEALENKNG